MLDRVNKGNSSQIMQDELIIEIIWPFSFEKWGLLLLLKHVGDTMKLALCSFHED